MSIGVDEIIPWVLPIATGLAAYYGAINGIRVKVAQLEEKLAALERRFESDHAELDRLVQQPKTMPLRRS